MSQGDQGRSRTGGCTTFGVDMDRQMDPNASRSEAVLDHSMNNAAKIDLVGQILLQGEVMQ